jgi:hypothetical protein
MSFLENDTYFSLPTGSFLLMSNLKYDELKIVDEIKENNENELCIAALQLAVHGFGNGSYGKVEIEGIEKDITQIFDENNVKYNNESNLIIEENDLTPKRLMRVFRYQIMQYFKENPGVESFLFRKYSDGGEAWYIFPGSEYYISEPEHVINLIETYENMDERLGTHFVKKIKTIFKSRKIFVPE